MNTIDFSLTIICKLGLSDNSRHGIGKQDAIDFIAYNYVKGFFPGLLVCVSLLYAIAA